jgi:hypothetical protein
MDGAHKNPLPIVRRVFRGSPRPVILVGPRPGHQKLCERVPGWLSATSGPVCFTPTYARSQVPTGCGAAAFRHVHRLTKPEARRLWSGVGVTRDRPSGRKVRAFPPQYGAGAAFRADARGGVSAPTPFKVSSTVFTCDREGWGLPEGIEFVLSLVFGSLAKRGLRSWPEGISRITSQTNKGKRSKADLSAQLISCERVTNTLKGVGVGTAGRARVVRFPPRHRRRGHGGQAVRRRPGPDRPGE